MRAACGRDLDSFVADERWRQALVDGSLLIDRTQGEKRQSAACGNPAPVTRLLTHAAPCDVPIGWRPVKRPEAPRHTK